MKKYTKNPKCPKCDSKDVSISYHKKEMGYGSFCREEDIGEKEHLCHYCRTCGFEWITRTLTAHNSSVKEV